MTDNILTFPADGGVRPARFTRDFEPSEVLERAGAQNLQAVVLFGYDETGSPWFDTSTLDAGELTLLAMMAKRKARELIT